jgi:hypothetical protein
MNGLQIIFLVVFFSKRLKPIRNYMLVYEPFDQNIDPLNPPKTKRTYCSDNNNNNHINNILDINNKINKNMSKKEKERQKSFLINS